MARQVRPSLTNPGVDYGRRNYHTQREFVVGAIQAAATGRYEPSHAGLHGRVACRLDEDAWSLKHYVHAHVVRMHTGGITGSGRRISTCKFMA